MNSCKRSARLHIQNYQDSKIENENTHVRKLSVDGSETANESKNKRGESSGSQTPTKPAGGSRVGASSTGGRRTGAKTFGRNSTSRRDEAKTGSGSRTQEGGENNESDVAVSAAIQEGRLQLREFLQSKEADPVLFPAAYLKECTQNFSEDKYLGIGGFGAVFLAIMTILSNKSL